jgi:hypothetical protein
MYNRSLRKLRALEENAINKDAEILELRKYQDLVMNMH